MAPEDERAIGLSKKKLLLLVLAACGFVTLGIWFISLDDATIEAQRRFSEPLLVHGLGLITIVFFGACGIIGIKKLFDKRPGLVFNSQGLLDNSSGLAAGLIPWSDILGVDIREVHSQKMLIIKLRDPQKYVERGGKVKQALYRANLGMFGSPIAITSSALRIGFSDLFSLFEEYRQRYGDADQGERTTAPHT